MILPKRRYLLLVLLALMIAVQMDDLAFATETVRITNLQISSDLRKVVIKGQGDIGRPSTFLLDKPPRLVIDFPGAGLDLSEGMKPEQKEDGLTVRAAKTPSGVRVVLDFGRGSVPEHKIHRMGNDLIVFLEERTAMPTTPHPSVLAERHLPQRTSPSVVTRPSDPVSAGNQELEVKATQIAGHLIVLKVADRKDPGNIFRVELGLDLDRLGFTSARIIPPARQKTSAVPPPAQARVVPREKTTDPASRELAQDSSNPRAGQEVGMIAPVHDPRTSQASQARASVPQEKANESDQSLFVPTPSRLPRPQPVTESLQARFYGQEREQATTSKWVAPSQEPEPAKPRTGPVPANQPGQSAPATVLGFVDQVLGNRPQTQAAR